MARWVDAVGKQDYGLATRDRAQLFPQDIVDGVVKSRTAAGAGATNGSLDLISIIGRFALHLDAIIKGHHHHAVCWFQFLDELDGSVLNFIEAPLCRAAGVDQQDDAEW